jgi:hypothetical protein
VVQAQAERRRLQEINKNATEIIGGVFIWEELFLDSLNDFLNGSLVSDLLASLIAALLDALAILLAELVLEHLGEQEVTTDSSGGHTDHDTNDDPDQVVILLLFLVEAEHRIFPPYFDREADTCPYTYLKYSPKT